MPQVTFIQPDGARRDVQVEPGQSLMRAAMSHDVEGIVAECGGSAMCATCHVYVVDGLSRTPSPAEEELDMLDCVIAERRPTSRLSCQLIMAPALDGLVLEVPEMQEA